MGKIWRSDKVTTRREWLVLVGVRIWVGVRVWIRGTGSVEVRVGIRVRGELG